MVAAGKNTALPAAELLTGILHNRLGRVVTQCADIRSGMRIADLDDDALNRAVSVAKKYSSSLSTFFLRIL